MLEVSSLSGRTFLDAGSGSGLFSLAARKLGASVTSFDYDPDSVACTERLRREHFPADREEKWEILHGSVLDTAFLSGLKKHDIVYSWGVLHHTGAMWKALDAIRVPVKDSGQLFIAIYNDQGWISDYWKTVKRLYNRNPLFRAGVTGAHLPNLAARMVARGVRGDLRPTRGMHLWHDYLDWLGGFPFEVAKPEELLEFYRARGFSLSKMTTCGNRHGCNQFVFRALASD